MNGAGDGEGRNGSNNPRRSTSKRKKNRTAGQSGKEAANDVPSWAQGEVPFEGESGNEFAKRLLDDKYGGGNYRKGPGTEFNRIRKWADRAFEDP